MIVAGFGARSGCSGGAFVRALACALAQHESAAIGRLVALCAPSFKAAEPGLHRLSQGTGLPLVLVPWSALQDEQCHSLTSSSRVLQHTGLSSVAEASALAGARCLAKPSWRRALLGPRSVVHPATCALVQINIGLNEEEEQ